MFVPISTIRPSRITTVLCSSGTFLSPEITVTSSITIPSPTTFRPAAPSVTLAPELAPSASCPLASAPTKPNTIAPTHIPRTIRLIAPTLLAESHQMQSSTHTYPFAPLPRIPIPTPECSLPDFLGSNLRQGVSSQLHLLRRGLIRGQYCGLIQGFCLCSRELFKVR